MAEANAGAASEAASDDELYVDPIAGQIGDFRDLLPEQLLPAWDAIAAYPIIGALVIAALFYLLAHLVRFVVLRSIGQITSRTRTSLDDALLRDLRSPIFQTVFFFGLTLATNAAALPAGTETIINLLVSLIIVSWMRAGLRLSSTLLDGMASNIRFQIVEPRTIPLFDLVIKLLILLFGSYALLIVWGINPVGWLASAGIVGIAVGFAAKDTLANLFSGFFILADSPYKVGDYINLDAGERGRVTHIGMRSTRMITRDDIEVTVPNAIIANGKIINESGGPYEKMRVRLKVGAAYGSDVHQVCEVLEKVAVDHPGVVDHPAPRVRMRAFGGSSLDFELLAWITEPEKRGLMLHELHMQVYDAFAEAGVDRLVWICRYTSADHCLGELDKLSGLIQERNG